MSNSSRRCLRWGSHRSRCWSLTGLGLAMYISLSRFVVRPDAPAVRPVKSKSWNLCRTHHKTVLSVLDFWWKCVRTHHSCFSFKILNSKEKCWHHYFFSFFLPSILLNSFALYSNENFSQEIKQNFLLKDFLLRIIYGASGRTANVFPLYLNFLRKFCT